MRIFLTERPVGNWHLHRAARLSLPRDRKYWAGNKEKWPERERSDFLGCLPISSALSHQESSRTVGRCRTTSTISKRHAWLLKVAKFLKTEHYQDARNKLVERWGEDSKSYKSVQNNGEPDVLLSESSGVLNLHTVPVWGLLGWFLACTTDRCTVGNLRSRLVCRALQCLQLDYGNCSLWKNSKAHLAGALGKKVWGELFGELCLKW